MRRYAFNRPKSTNGRELSKDLFFYFLFFLLSLLSIQAYFSDEKRPKIITIIHTDELNGAIYPKAQKEGEFQGQYSGGIALLSSQIQSLKQKAFQRSSPVFLFDAGSTLFGGNIYPDKKDGEMMMDFMNQVKYDCIGLGNNDFDYGAQELFKLLKKAHFPIVNSNIQSSNNVDQGILRPYTIIYKKDLKIGVLGLINNDLELIVPQSRLEGIKVDTNITKLEENLQILQSKNCDLIILLSDLYDINQEIVLAQKYNHLINVIISTTRFSQEFDHHISVGDVSILRTPKNLQYVGELEITFDPKIKKILHRQWMAHPVVSSKISPDPYMSKKQELRIQKLNQQSVNPILGTALINLDFHLHKESIFGDFVTDIVRNKYQTDLVIINSCNLLGLQAGTITLFSLQKSIPYNDDLIYLELTGRQIRDLFENNLSQIKKFGLLQQSGATFKYNLSRPAGRQIQDFMINNSPLDDHKSYSIITTAYLHQGNDGHQILKQGKKYRPCNEKLLTIVQTHIKDLANITYSMDNRMCQEKQLHHEKDPLSKSVPRSSKFFKKLFSLDYL